MQLGIYERTHPLLEEKGITSLVQSHALVCGAGGVGGFVAEALARGGIGKITLVDHDVVTVSNKNRQIIALDSTVGKSKVQLLAARIKDINAQCEVVIIDTFLLESDIEPLLDEGPYTYVIDAIDTVSTKIKLLELSCKRGFKTLSSMGAGGKMDPTKIHLADLYDTEHCGLASKCRSELKKRGIKPGQILTCFSSEVSKKPLAPWPSLTGGRPRAVNGTISYIPSTFGLMLAGAAIHHAATGKFPKSAPTPSVVAQKAAQKKKLEKDKAKKRSTPTEGQEEAKDGGGEVATKKAKKGE
eukprot:TRINITY_DN21379_c0_g6_i1.p1 TRINITY_DN21379_c0_g6~~TRINITY_DN21379_c0_g6_i1.p1  ORF type:complete len:316 (+),score=60.08 TRINITY_DN21379_c0_g6_i1:54-950(+)